MSERPNQPSSNVDADPSTRDQLVADIKDGHDVWAPPNFEPRTDMNDGLTLDFWRAGYKIGYIDGDEAHGFNVYGPPYSDRGSTKLTTGGPAESVIQAKRILEDYLNDASLLLPAENSTDTDQPET